MSGEKKVAGGTYLFREGDPPDAMYIVKSGTLAITKTKGTSEIVLAEIGTGSMVGEMALFDKKPRSANVKAAKDAAVIALPYTALEKQLESLPTWVRAVMKTMNENIREANKKIKILENSSPDAERFPPHVINRLIYIFSFVGFRYGEKENDILIVPQNRLRNTTIQVFMEATNKMTALLAALQDLGYVKIEELGEARQKISNLAPDFLFSFVEWYNEWLFKQDKDKVSIDENEVKLLGGILHFAKKVEPGKNNARKVNLKEAQNDSMKDLGFLIKVEDLGGLIEKKILGDKTSEEAGIFTTVIVEDIEPLMKNWKLIWDLKKKLG